MPKVILVYSKYRQVKDTPLKPRELLAWVGPTLIGKGLLVETEIKRLKPLDHMSLSCCVRPWLYKLLTGAERLPGWHCLEITATPTFLQGWSFCHSGGHPSLITTGTGCCQKRRSCRKYLQRLILQKRHGEAELVVQAVAPSRAVY